jgi:predicted RNase H-like HicB family nuclease
MKKDLNYYLNLPWTYRMEWSDEDKCYIISIAELPGCSSDGETIEEAAHMIQDALKSHILCMMKHSDIIPEPPKQDDYKGKIAYRTSSNRHYRIAKRAAVERKSISKVIDELIDKGLAS